MQFIYLLTPTRLEMLTDGPTAEEQTIVGEHLQHRQRLGDGGRRKFFRPVLLEATNDIRNTAHGGVSSCVWNW